MLLDLQASEVAEEVAEEEEEERRGYYMSISEVKARRVMELLAACDAR